MEHAEEVFSMEFVAGNQPTEPLRPGKQPFHGPAAFVAPERSAVLALAPILAVGCNHLDSVFLFEMPVERVRVIRLVADEPYRKSVEETAGERRIDEFRLVGRGAVHSDGHRNTGNSGDGHDLGPLAPLGFPPCEAPFLALAKLPSISPSFRSSNPFSCSFSAKVRSAFSSCPERTHCWNRPCTVWYGGYFLGNSRHCAPVRNIHNTPFSTPRVSAGGRPRPSARRANRKSGSSTPPSSSDTSPRPRMRPSAASPVLPSLCSHRHQISSQKHVPLFIGQVLVSFRASVSVRDLSANKLGGFRDLIAAKQPCRTYSGI